MRKFVHGLLHVDEVGAECEIERGFELASVVHTADRLGFARVTGQEVICALIELLLTDPKLSAEVTRNIRDRR